MPYNLGLARTRLHPQFIHRVILARRTARQAQQATTTRTFAVQVIFSDPDLSTLGAPDPDGEKEIDEEVDNAGVEGWGFGGFPPKFIIKTKGGGSNQDGRVTERESNIGQGVGLGKGERGEDRGKRVIRG